MDAMNKGSSESSYPWNDERRDLQQRINCIKVMLWANDYGAAQTELAAVVSQYGPLLLESLKIKKRLTSIYRLSKPHIERKYRSQGLEGRDLEHHTQEEIAGLLHLETERDDSLYLISPIANIVRKLDERVEEQTKQPGFFSRKQSTRSIFDLNPSPPDHLTGYRITANEIGPQQWEVRAYQLTPPLMEPDVLLMNLQNNFNNKLLVVEKTSERIEWPLWYRAFLSNAFVDLKFFSPERFELSVVGDKDYLVEEYLKTVLMAVAHSQKSHLEGGSE